MATGFHVECCALTASYATAAAMRNRRLLPGTKAETFKKAVKVPGHLPLRDRTMALNTNGKCAAAF